MAPSFLPGKAHDEVAQVHWADGRVGEERIFFQVVVLEVLAQESLRLDVAGPGGPAWANGDELAGVIVGALAIEVLGKDQCGGKCEERDGNHCASQVPTPWTYQTCNYRSFVALRAIT